MTSGRPPSAKPILPPTTVLNPAVDTHALDHIVSEVESELDALGRALLARDNAGLERASTALQHKLSAAVELYRQASASGRMPPELRHRLKRASGQVVRHREALTRATVALDRALDVLMPGVQGHTVYTEQARMSGATNGRPFVA